MQRQIGSFRKQVEIIAVESHRNGTTGDHFYVITFYWVDKDLERGITRLPRKMVGIVFDGLLKNKQADCPVSVLDVDLLAQGDVGFGSNSWRGDYFAPSLYAAIAMYGQKSDEFLGITHEEKAV